MKYGPEIPTTESTLVIHRPPIGHPWDAVGHVANQEDARAAAEEARALEERNCQIRIEIDEDSLSVEPDENGFTWSISGRCKHYILWGPKKRAA